MIFIAALSLDVRNFHDYDETYHHTSSFPVPFFPEAENCDKTLRGGVGYEDKGRIQDLTRKGQAFPSFFFLNSYFQ